MKVADAVVCLDCDTLFSPQDYTACPGCSKTRSIALSDYFKPLAAAVSENYADCSGD